MMQSQGYLGAFTGTRLRGARPAEDEFETTRGGYRLATSVGGTLTGRGGNFIIIDDPIKPSEAMSIATRRGVKEWYSSTLYSRLNNKTDDVIILIMQRVHLDDLVGHVLEQEGWTHLNLPAIAQKPERFDLGDGRIFTRLPGDLLHPEREPKSALDDARRNLGEMTFSAQYQQMPVAEAGNIVKGQWLRVFDVPFTPLNSDRYYQSWDMASTSREFS